MPGFVTQALGRAASRVPGLKRIPVLKLLAVAEVMLLVRDHMAKLDPAERRRVLELVRRARGRKGNLSAQEQEELEALIAKAEPRLLFGTAADKLSPVPLPGRVVRGPRKPA